MNKFKEGDGIVRASMDARWARIGFKATVLCGNMYLDALGKINDIIDDYWELAEDTSKTVTVTHEGKVYELNKDYLFGKFKTMLKLKWIDSLSEYPFQTIEGCHETGYKEIFLCTPDLGTITPAPIDLIDGNAYMFDYHKSRKPAIGVYSASNNTFLTVSNDHFVFNCTNIRPMTVAESK
jgi:hypothetical protein